MGIVIHTVTNSSGVVTGTQKAVAKSIYGDSVVIPKKSSSAKSLLVVMEEDNQNNKEEKCVERRKYSFTLTNCVILNW